MDKKFFGGAGIIVFSAVIIAAVSFNGSPQGLGSGKAAFISINGAISASSGGSFGSQGVTPGTLRDLNERAINQGATAIIYEINSGGGAVVASKEVKREIESVEVPTVCRFRDVAASGAYLASLGCDRIVADTASMTGSIGVKSSYLEYSGLMKKLGVDYVNITSGELKGVGSPYRNITDRERELLQQKADIVHEDFVQDVKESRNLSESEVDTVKTGEIFLGAEARELGLIDTLGGRATAVETAENLTDTELETFEVETREGFDFLSLMNIESWLTGSKRSPLEASLR